MKNMQVIDGAQNCTYDVFEVSDADFALVFPLPEQDIEFADDFFARLGDGAKDVYARLWVKRADKKSMHGIHGTLFCGLDFKKAYYPTKRDDSDRSSEPKSRTALARAWQLAAEDLNLRFVSPFTFLDQQGDSHTCSGLLVDFGGPKGTLIVSRYDEDPDADETGADLGFYTSALSPFYYDEYDRDLFIDTLVDWGWYGDAEERPHWFDHKQLTHLDQVALIRRSVKQEQYSEAVRQGRRELASGRDSSELLVLMATAVLLGDGNDDGSLEEARQWLDRATAGDPGSIDAALELAHFLDAVVDEQESAAATFESAALQALRYLEDALQGMQSTGTSTVEIQKAMQEALKMATDSAAQAADLPKK